MLRHLTVIHSWPSLLVLSALATTIFFVVVSAQDTAAGSQVSTDIKQVLVPFAANFVSILDRTGLQSIQGMIAVAAICGLIPIAHWFNRTKSIGHDDRTALSSKLLSPSLTFFSLSSS